MYIYFGQTFSFSLEQYRLWGVYSCMNFIIFYFFLLFYFICLKCFIFSFFSTILACYLLFLVLFLVSNNFWTFLIWIWSTVKHTCHVTRNRREKKDCWCYMMGAINIKREFKRIVFEYRVWSTTGGFCY